MKKKLGSSKMVADKLVQSIRRKTKHTYSAEEKNCIVLVGLRGDEHFSQQYALLLSSYGGFNES